MLDVRITAYVVPIAEQPQASLTPVIAVRNYADEGAVITGLIRIYRETTGLLIYSSELAVTQLDTMSSANIAALTPFDPPAPADDDYFIKADIVATSYLPGPPKSATLGAWYFDIKTPPMGEAPAGHHVTHENGGSDPVDITGLPGTEEFLRTDGANPLLAYIDAVESAAPAAPAASTARIYAFNFKGFTFLKYRDATGMVRQLARDSVFVARNNSGSPIPAMTPVYASGSSGNVPTIEPTKADAAGTMPAIGVTLEIIADASFGRVMESGLMENVNTNAWNEGDELFIDASVAGDMTITPPTYPDLRQEIAHVLVKGIGNGALQIAHHSAANDSLIDHDGLMNLDHDAHTQYQLRHEIFYENEFFTMVGTVTFPWYYASVSLGTFLNLTSDQNHPGIVQLRSSTTANSGYRVHFNTFKVILIAGGEVTKCWHRPQTLAGTTRRFGFHTSNSVTAPTDGAFLWQDPATGIIYGRTINVAGNSTTGTGFQLVTNVWYCEKIVINSDATQVDFYCYAEDGTELWHDSLTTNIPTAAGDEVGHGVVATNSGTTAVALDDVDYLSILIPDRRPNL